MAKVTLDKIIKLGLVKGHQATEYEAYEELDENGVFKKPIFKSGEDTTNLTSLSFPLIKEDGTYYPPEEPFVVRVRLKGDDKWSEWFTSIDCMRDCDFDYTLPVIFCKEN